MEEPKTKGMEAWQKRKKETTQEKWKHIKK
jgi:hypothetical protein